MNAKQKSPSATDGNTWSREDIIDGLKVISRKRGENVGLGDVIVLVAAIRFLEEGVSETAMPITDKTELTFYMDRLNDAVMGCPPNGEGRAKLETTWDDLHSFLVASVLRAPSTASAIATKNAAPQGNKAGAASSGAGFKASHSDSTESVRLPNNPAVAAPELVHAICERFRMANDEESCEKCPARVEVPNHGEGVPGCYMLAEETVRLVREATPSATLMPPQRYSIVLANGVVTWITTVDGEWVQWDDVKELYVSGSR